MFGALKNYKLYLDTEPRSEPILVNEVIALANSISGQLEVILNDINSNPDFAISAFPIYQNVVVLQLSSITEWKVAHNKNPGDFLLDIQEEACEQTQDVKRALRKKSDARFTEPYFVGCIEQCAYGDEKWSYSFDEDEDGKSEVTEDFHYNSNYGPSPDKIIAKHKRTAFLDYSIVPELLEFEGELSSACTKALLDYHNSTEAEDFINWINSDITKQKEQLRSFDVPNLITNWAKPQDS